MSRIRDVNAAVVATRRALDDGTIQAIATDHAPHTLEEKAKPYPQSPAGLPAIENALPLMLNEVTQGRFRIEQVVRWMCDAPARVWGIVGKGRIATGYDADLVLVDPTLTRTIRYEEQFTKCRWSPWHGESLTGWPVMTWVGGRLVFRRGPGNSFAFDESARGVKATFDHSRGGYWNTPDGIGTR